MDDFQWELKKLMLSLSLQWELEAFLANRSWAWRQLLAEQIPAAETVQHPNLSLRTGPASQAEKYAQRQKDD